MAVTGITSTVDLSRLPAPAIVEPLSYDTILADMVADLRARSPIFSAIVNSDPAMKVLQVAAYRELLIRQRVNDAGRQAMVAYATGSNLEHLAALLGVTRLLLNAGDPANGIAATLEDDEALRRRVVLAPFGFSVAGPTTAYVFHALSADGNVLDASATSPAPGEVLISVLSAIGNGQADAALLAKVAAAVSADTVRPLTDKVTVQSAVIVNYAIDAVLDVYTGPDTALIRRLARERLDGLIVTSRKLGRDLTLSALYAALHVEGVKSVTLAAPTATVNIGLTQATWCTGIRIRIAGIDA